MSNLQTELDAHFAEIDTDQSGKIEFSEFIQLMCGSNRPVERTKIAPLSTKVKEAHACAQAFKGEEEAAQERVEVEASLETRAQLDALVRRFSTAPKEMEADLARGEISCGLARDFSFLRTIFPPEKLRQGITGDELEPATKAAELEVARVKQAADAARAHASEKRAELGKLKDSASLQMKDAFRLFEKFEENIKNLRKVFDRFDNDGSGELSKDELANVSACMRGLTYVSRSALLICTPPLCPGDERVWAGVQRGGDERAHVRDRP